jgi:hypothetical protein
VGYDPILINSPGNSYVIHVGYPGTGRFAQYCPPAGVTWWSCYPWWVSSPIGGYVRQYVGNNSTEWWEVGMGGLIGHGSSGGPWFELYNGYWYVASDLSQCWSSTNNCANESDNVWGPYFNGSTLSLLNYAQTQ